MIRKAKLGDIPEIHKLINDFARQEVMLPIAIGDMFGRLRDFWVAEEDGKLLGAVAIHPTWDTLVELRSLAVCKTVQGGGLGRKLVETALSEAVELGATEVFTLTYIPDFFEKFGFARVDRSDLPHKVWIDCMRCPKFPDCGEVAMLKPLT